MTKAAVFDLDGVLLDSMGIWNDLGARYLRSLGVTPEEGLNEILFSMSMEQGAEYLHTHYALPQSAAEVGAGIAGMLYAGLLAFASINLNADQTIGGTALNLLATAIAVVIAKYFSDSGSAKLNYSNKPFLFSIGGLELSIFVPLGIVLLIISYVVLYKTRFGLRLRACGEHQIGRAHV